MTGFSTKMRHYDYLTLVGYFKLLSNLELSRYLDCSRRRTSAGIRLPLCFHSQTTYYTITTGNQDVNRRPTQWKLEGSNDGTNWELLDAHSGVSWDG